MTDDLTGLLDRLRRLRRGETALVDLRSAADPATMANAAIAELAKQNREPDEFILAAHQEVALGVPLGSLKTLFGYPARVVYVFDEDEE